MQEALNIALVGVVIVFGALCLIILCIKLYSGIITGFSRRKDNYNNNNNSNGNNNPTEHLEKTDVDSNSNSDGLDPELIAVITAAITASLDNSGTGLRVKSIKRVGHTTAIWNIAGRNEYILSRL